MEEYHRVGKTGILHEGDSVELLDGQPCVYRSPDGDHYTEHTTHGPAGTVSIIALPALETLSAARILGG